MSPTGDDPVQERGGAEPYQPLDFATPRRRSSGVVWIFLPVVALLAFALWQRSEPRRTSTDLGVPDAPDRLGGSAVVDGWSAAVESAEGFELRLRLEPLHPVVERQAFDATSLASRFRARGKASIPGAQPWRLTLSAPRRGDVSLQDPAVPVAVDDLSEVRIEGLEPLVRGSANAGARDADGGVEDPLSALFGFPAAPLRAGERCDLVFWGLRPADEVVV
ncbi:MAG: hypothetical protein AAGB93_08200, partial [Planctomycetota bacterium]